MVVGVRAKAVCKRCPTSPVKFLAFRRATLHEAAELFSCHRAAPVFGSMSERDKQRDGAVQKRAPKKTKLPSEKVEVFRQFYR